MIVARPREPFGIVRRAIQRSPGPPRGSRTVASLVTLLAAVLMAAGCADHQLARLHHAAATPVPSAPARSAYLGPGADTRAENALPGYPGWRVTRAGRGDAIEGYTDHASAVPGSPVRLFVSTTASSFRVRALRFGWYGGALARLVWTSPAIPGLRQHAPVVRAHGMVVAPWRPSLTLPTAGWPPGSYLLRLDAVSGVQRFVPLVIRSPSVAGRLVLVQPTASFQAYNGWGGYDLYQGPDGSYATRARVVSFDRPYSGETGAGSFFQEEQPLLSYAERLGLPLAYVTSVDLDLHPHVLDGATGVVSEAHDEYWSPGMRATVTRARDHGVNVAFFGANAVYRKIRFESSPLGRDRIEINYKNPLEDPLYGTDNARVTGNWPDPPDADPESALTGQAYGCFATSAPMVLTRPASWLWAGGGARPGITLPGLVGVEFDVPDSSGAAPHPVQVFARSPENCYGQPVDSEVTYYVARSRAGVFDAGTEDWACGLPAVVMRARVCPRGTARPVVQRLIAAATRNVLRAFAAGPAGRAHPVR